MNQRIRELAKQAKLELEKDIKDGKKDWKNTSQSYDEMVQEKFAELIVRECMQVANSKAEGIDLDRELYLYTTDIEYAIKEHFGVEEKKYFSLT